MQRLYMNLLQKRINRPIIFTFAPPQFSRKFRQWPIWVSKLFKS